MKIDIGKKSKSKSKFPYQLIRKEVLISYISFIQKKLNGITYNTREKLVD